MQRPQTTLILAMSADGKIADCQRSPARFASPIDKEHLERQVALVDAVIFGAGTLRAYHTTLPVSQPHLLQERKLRGQSPQPLQIVCSRSGELEPRSRFFQQAIPRWLLTTSLGQKRWLEKLAQEGKSELAKIVVAETATGEIAWQQAFTHLAHYGCQKLAILGGGELTASLVSADLIDEIWLTICPLIIGGATAPTPVDGMGFSLAQAQKLQLLSVKQIEQEVFLHYRRQH